MLPGDKQGDTIQSFKRKASGRKPVTLLGSSRGGGHPAEAQTAVQLRPTKSPLPWEQCCERVEDENEL